MKKFLTCLLMLISINIAFAEENYKIIENQEQIYYSPIDNIWSLSKSTDSDLLVNKELIEGNGSYSLYKYSDGSIAFALATDCEIISNGKLVVVDNNLLKFSQIIYYDNKFEQIPISEEEIKNVFFNIEILKISQIDTDNKTWLHKPFRKNKTILLLNDTNKFFHQINCKSKNAQNENIKGLITFSRYGIFTFKHFGERNGKLIFYIR